MEKEDDAVKYRIHVFNRDRTPARRKAMWINAGILIMLSNNLGYARMFSMPCKLVQIEIPLGFAIGTPSRISCIITSIFICHSGRRPFRTIKTDQQFADALLEAITWNFNESLPKCVAEEFNNKEYCRIMDLTSGRCFDYAQYMRQQDKCKGVS